MFFTKYNRPEKVLEENSGEILVETAGFKPVKDLINELIQAGKRLKDHSPYDYGPEDDDDDGYIDRTRDVGYDLADASRDARDVSDRLNNQAQDLMDSRKAPAAAGNVPGSEGHFTPVAVDPPSGKGE